MNPSNTRPLTVVVTHGEPLVAQGLASVLAQHSDFEVHHKAPPPGSTVDVLVTDYRQGMLHAEAMSRSRRRGSLRAARVLVFGLSRREQDVRRAMEVGIQGFLVLGCDLAELSSAVRALGMGTRYYDMSVVERMAESLTREPLTTREFEILRLLVQGQCNKSIARDLSIALGTVKSHVKAILGKLDASSRTHAASIAVQRGLVDQDADQPSEPVALGMSFPHGQAANRRMSFAAA
jgi:two-component system NarL family response regulator